MGPAIVICALVFLLRAAPAAQAAAYAALAAVTSFATPIVRAAAWVDRLPIWLQWYVRPAGDYTTFTLFPWAGFVFAGAAAGALLVTVRGDDERRLNVRLALSGAGLVAVGLVAAAWPTMYTVPVSFWTSSPAFFIIRVGIVMAAVAALVFVPEFDALAPLATLGRSSLFMYWIHVELVYGYASWLWRHSLPIWAWMPAFAGFAVLMYRAIGWRDRGLQAWRQRSLPARTPVGTSS
jgi:uncharacterized membrane protein